jgi:hypothetical protein
MYITITHKNSGQDASGDIEEGQIASGADMAIRVFAQHDEAGKLTPTGFRAIDEAIRKAVGERHHIAFDSRRSQIEFCHDPEVRFACTVYGNDARGKYDQPYAYRFNTEA